MVERDERDDAHDGAQQSGGHGGAVDPGHDPEAYEGRVKSRGMSADGLVTTMCSHGMDAAWCYLCRVDGYGVDPQVLWGLALDDDLYELAQRAGPMDDDLAGYLRFFCEEFRFGYDETFTQQEAATVIDGFLADAPTASQRQTIAALDGGATVDDMTYAEARTKIRRMVALRGLRSA